MSCRISPHKLYRARTCTQINETNAVTKHKFALTDWSHHLNILRIRSTESEISTYGHLEIRMINKDRPKKMQTTEWVKWRKQMKNMWLSFRESRSNLESLWIQWVAHVLAQSHHADKRAQCLFSTWALVSKLYCWHRSAIPAHFGRSCPYVMESTVWARGSRSNHLMWGNWELSLTTDCMCKERV